MSSDNRSQKIDPYIYTFTYLLTFRVVSAVIHIITVFVYGWDFRGNYSATLNSWYTSCGWAVTFGTVRRVGLLGGAAARLGPSSPRPLQCTNHRMIFATTSQLSHQFICNVNSEVRVNSSYSML